MNQTRTVIEEQTQFNAWVQYPHLDRLAMMKNEGRELLAQTIFWTEKRDGSNICLWLKAWDGKKRDYDLVDLNGKLFEVMVSSRNQEHGVVFLTKVKATGQYEKIVELLKENPSFAVFGEYIQVGKSITKVEEIHDKPDLVVFDIYDRNFAPDGGRFLGYNAVYQHCHHFDIPIVKLLAVTRHSFVHVPADLPKEEMERAVDFVYNTIIGEGGQRADETTEPQEVGVPLYVVRDAMLRWAKEAKREGVVGKAFNGLELLYFKEKQDLPSHVTTLIDGTPKQNIKLPPLPESEILGAIDKARTELLSAGIDLKDKKQAMPVIVRYVEEEAKKHQMKAPSNIFSYYQQFLEVQN